MKRLANSYYAELDLYCGAFPFVTATQCAGEKPELHICGADHIDLGQRDFQFSTWEECMRFIADLPCVEDENQCVNRKAYWKAFNSLAS